MVGVTCQERQHGGGFGKNHLFENGIDLSPGTRLLQRRAGTGAVPDIGDGNLDGIFVHGRRLPQNLGADDRILGEIFRHPASDHQQSRCFRLDLDLRQFPEIPYRIDGKVLLRMPVLVKDQTESCAAVGKGRAENRHFVFIGRLDEGAFLFGMNGQIAPHFPNELPGRIGPRLQPIGNFTDRAVAGLQGDFIDKGVVDPVDVKLSQDSVIDMGAPLVMPEPQGLEEIHIHDGRAGCDHGIDHVVLDEVRINLHAPGGARAAGNCKDHRAAPVFQHSPVDVGGHRQVPGRKRHPPHGCNDRRRIERCHVDMPHRLLQVILFFHKFSLVLPPSAVALPIIHCPRKVNDRIERIGSAAAQFILVILYFFWYCHGGATDMINEVLTVSTLNCRIKDLLEAGFDLLWVEGEVSNLRRPASGHIYFTLKDDRSQIRSVIFRSPFASRAAFSNRRIAFDPEEGMQVICRARLSVYSPRGEYQLIVESMEPKGIGALQLAFEQMKGRLEKEGLFDAARKKRIPFLPERIGIITSPTGAVIQDILTIAGRRFPSVGILVAAVRVQGSEAPAEIIQAIDRMNAVGNVDVMILARGGGSLEDLAPFNDEGVARAIFRSRVPVISAVGHETDFTIADLVADLRAPTPSAAAELAVPNRLELVANLEDLHHRMFHLYQRMTHRFRERLMMVSERLRDPKRRLVDLRLLADDRLERTHRALDRMTAERKQALVRLENRLSRVTPAIRIREHRAALDRTRKSMIGRAGKALERGGERLNFLTAMLDSLSPLAVLNRGYSIARRLPDGTIIRRAGDVSAGVDVRVRVASGSFDARVTSVYEE